MNDAPDFEPIKMLAALNDGGVRYVVIGAVAGRMFGSPALTGDLDICYARDQTNLEALASVLAAMHARLRGTDAGVPFRLDARTLRNGDSFTFTTDFGDLDILGTPSGTTGYEDLAANSQQVDLDTVTVQAAGIEDLMRMKRAAGRPKDRVHLEILGALRDELDARG